MSTWEPLGNVAPNRLTEARLESHHAVQWLARATRAYCTPVPDDSHTSLTWDTETSALVTQAITPNLAFGLRLNPLSLVAIKSKGNESLSLLGHTEKDVHIWVGDILKEAQLDAAKLNASAPYTLPKHPLDSGLAYGLAKKETFDELGKYFNNAAGLLDTVRQAQSNASPVRCWPHHFDIATLISLDTSGVGEVRSIGIGMSPGDDTYPEPYLYISPWPYPSQPDLSDVRAPAFWHRQGFTAVILKGSDLVSMTNGSQPENTAQVVTHAITLCYDLLKH